MKKQKRKKITKEERHWEEAASIYEDEEICEKIMMDSELLDLKETLELFGSSKKEPISIRIPDYELKILKRLAKKYNRNYQSLINIAIEQYIKNVFLKAEEKTKKKRVA